MWTLLKQETVSGCGISWTICKSAPCSRQITTPAPATQFFYMPDALPATQPTASKHWRQQQSDGNLTVTSGWNCTWGSGQCSPHCVGVCEMILWLIVCVFMCQSDEAAALLDEESSKQTIEVVGKHWTNTVWLCVKCSESVTNSLIQPTQQACWMHCCYCSV